ncbi:MAG: hypothetical protein EAX95_09915 [Candidatus Thorarchaeota archaeon]|nr:hypothetical protein [Candidatus Thorarchaeota archaeon]
MATLSWKCFAFTGWLLLLIVQTPLMAVAILDTEPSLKSGPYVNRLVFEVIPDMDDQVLQLLNGEVDLIGDAISPEYISELGSAEAVDLAMTENSLFGCLSINCAKYPYNLTVFRRALAIAIDKQFICSEIWDGLATPQDSLLPSISVWSAEPYLDETFYASNMVLANQMLDEAGFADVDADGWRNAPDGSKFHVDISCPENREIPIQVAETIEAALHFLGVSAKAGPREYMEYITRIAHHCTYDMAYLEMVPEVYDVSWLAYNFVSKSADLPFFNYPNFKNETYDSWFDEMIHSTQYQQVWNAAIEMQKILVYECPIIVCYVSRQVSAYRNTDFQGFVNDFQSGIGSWWSYYKARLRNPTDVALGGVLRTTMSTDMPSFNFMINPDGFGWNVLGESYDSLIRIGPDGNDIKWLAKSYIIETHSDNPDVANGHTRLVFDLVENATWSDGYPLTALDVAFTLNYYPDCSNGNPYASGLQDLMAAYASGTYQVTVEFDTESYWYLHTVGLKPIIPYHVFSEMGLDGWELWTPTPPDDALVTSGPFMLHSYEEGSRVELERNPNYFYRFLQAMTLIPTTTTTTTSTATSTPDTSLLASLVFISGALSVPLVVGGFFWLRRGKESA